MQTLNEMLRAKYLEYVNDYLTVDKFAEDNGLHPTEARRCLSMGKHMHETYVAEHKALDDIHHIRVWFREFPEGDVIALWDDGSTNAGMIASYQHIGQHSEASPDLVDELPYVLPEDYAALKQELESIGYAVTVID